MGRERKSGRKGVEEGNLPLPHPLPSTFLLSPYFSRGSNVKNSLAQPEFRSLRTGTLATQAKNASNDVFRPHQVRLRDRKQLKTQKSSVILNLCVKIKKILGQRIHIKILSRCHCSRKAPFSKWLPVSRNRGAGF